MKLWFGMVKFLNYCVSFIDNLRKINLELTYVCFNINIVISYKHNYMQHNVRKIDVLLERMIFIYFNHDPSIMALYRKKVSIIKFENDQILYHNDILNKIE